MKKQLKLTLLVTAVSFIVFTSFKKGDLISSPVNHKIGTIVSHSLKYNYSTPVTITAVFDFSTFPDVFGTFTTSGALNISGDAEMVVGPTENGKSAHCVVTLTALDGQITIS